MLSPHGRIKIDLKRTRKSDIVCEREGREKYRMREREREKERERQRVRETEREL